MVSKEAKSKLVVFLVDQLNIKGMLDDLDRFSKELLINYGLSDFEIETLRRAGFIVEDKECGNYYIPFDVNFSSSDIYIAAGKQLMKRYPTELETAYYIFQGLYNQYPRPLRALQPLMYLSIKKGQYNQANSIRKELSLKNIISPTDSNYYLFLLYKLAPDDLSEIDCFYAKGINLDSVLPHDEEELSENHAKKQIESPKKKIRELAFQGEFSDAISLDLKIRGPDEIEIALLKLLDLKSKTNMDDVDDDFLDIINMPNTEDAIVMKPMNEYEFQFINGFIDKHKIKIRCDYGIYKGEGYAFFRPAPKDNIVTMDINFQLNPARELLEGEHKNYREALSIYLASVDNNEEDDKTSSSIYALIAYCYYHIENLTLEEIEMGLAYTKLAAIKAKQAKIIPAFDLDNVIRELEKRKSLLANQDGCQGKSYVHTPAKPNV